MLEEAINLIKKQKEMYKIQEENIRENIKKKKLREAIKKDITEKTEILDYILDILNKQQKK